MIILHAGFYDEQLLLWGERRPDDDWQPLKRRGRKPKEPRLEPFPFDVGAAHLGDILKAAEDGWPRGGSLHALPKKVTLWVPSTEAGPIPSSSLMGDVPTEDTIALRPWSLSALAFSGGDMGKLLCAFAEKSLWTPGVIIGDDLRYWTEASRFAAVLIAKQQYLPQIEPVGDDYQALWRPLYLGESAAQRLQLAHAMPPVCRALTPGDQNGEPDRSSLAVLTEFTGTLVDLWAREQDLSQKPAIAPGAVGKPKTVKASKGQTGTVHDAWIEALTGPNRILRGDKDEIKRLIEQNYDWQRRLYQLASAPMRLTFRLEEPQTGVIPDGGSESGISDRDISDSGLRERGSKENSRKAVKKAAPAAPAGWYVRFLLQGRHDGSLLFPVESIWKKTWRYKLPLEERGSAWTPGQVRELALQALGQASGLCPPVEQSLHDPAPAGFELDTDKAYAFLTNDGPALEAAGFGVQLPAWWTPKGTKMRLRARAHVQSPSLQGGGGLSLSDLVQVDWQLLLGDDSISVTELQELARLKSPLIQYRGQWIQLDAAEMAKTLDYWKKKSAHPSTVRDVIEMTLGVKEIPLPIDLEGVTAEGEMGQLLDQLQGNVPFAELPEPEDFHGTLRPYQRRGYSWLTFLQRWGLGACLADDMGLGKTVQTLALLQRYRQSTAEPRPVLLICPTSVIGNWQKEAARFTPDLPVVVHHGADRRRGDLFREDVDRSALVISSYALVQRDLEALRSVEWGGIILDEAQNIKNAETKQAKASRSLQAGFRIALTGTPVENNVGDLWSIMEFLNPGFLGVISEFRRKFFLPIQKSRDAEAMERLKKLTSPFVLRRLKSDPSIIRDLPDKLEMKVYCTLTKEQSFLYAAVLQDAMEELEGSDGIRRKGIILRLLSLFKQICNHPAQFLGDNSDLGGRSGKLARLTEMVEEVLATGERALIFTQFTEMGHILKKHLEETFGREVLFLHGGVPKKRRDEMVERFQNAADGPPLFLLSLKAGGTGLNLTRANHVFHYDRWWNPAVENQATDRAYRIGQKNNVQVHKFICAGTMEEKVDEMIQRKQELAEQVVGTGEDWLTELSTAELRDLFALRGEALGV
ncbi:ATP-dependent helicase [Heliobacillus mobilis]|uniref:ATP-dependent helicase n=1 Tax=Heliobacterium mobile TaxID=28064 RepID=A0A6I3SP72_HELMO|nr:DEAD/DEAH box helicase [Heliobacterium mobile]MTV50516.1 ATP-dependent helicase [Heliobacterium mobile]